MTGRLDIGRGKDYGAFWKLAKHHAEVLHHHNVKPHPAHADSVKVDGTVIPETGSNGSSWVLKFKTGPAQQQTGAVDGNASRADVLHGMIQQLLQLEGPGLIGPATTDGDNIYLKAGILGPITDAVIEAGGTNP